MTVNECPFSYRSGCVRLECVPSYVVGECPLDVEYGKERVHNWFGNTTNILLIHVTLKRINKYTHLSIHIYIICCVVLLSS